jgi:hypothetical protein
MMIWSAMIRSAGFVLLFAAMSNAADIHVAMDGCDSNPGTESRPVATLHRAQTLVRQQIGKRRADPVQVIIGEGTYYLEQPLEFTPEDSGTVDGPVIWRAADGETVVLSGGVPIDGTWQQGDDGIWSVQVPGTGDAWNFRQLFVGGKRAVRARYPNADRANPFLYATGGGMDHVLVDAALIKESWGKAPDAQINIVPQWKFFNQWNTVTGVDTNKGCIEIADSERHGKITKGNWFWIEGVKEELDQPGEWYLDRAKEMLYYMPEPGVDPNHLSFVAPRLNVIVDIKGEVEKKTHVEHIRFSGLAFRHTTFTLAHIEARVHTDGAIRMENARHCRIEDCHVENVGGYAFWLHLDSRRNVIDRNTVLHTGGGGVLFTGARLSYMDDSKLYTPGDVAETVFPVLNRVTRNTVKHCGQYRYYGGGVHLDSRPASMAMEPGNYIAHNYFADLSRNGIFAFRNQGGNVVEYNHIHDAMQTTIDGACIHFATMNHLNAPNYILNNWLYDIWGYEQKPEGKPKRHLANGIFLDWDSSNMIVKSNYVYNAGGAAIKVIWQNWNVTQEGNQASRERIVPPFVDELGPQGTATHGIDLEQNRLTGGVIHYSDSNLVTRTGKWEKKTLTGMSGLFTFNVLEATQGEPASITYRLPIPEDGTSQISLLYKPQKACATNVEVRVQHANGVSERNWNMQKGNRHGFAVEVDTFSFEVGRPAAVTLLNTDANGVIVADSVAFVKIDP